ncbi:MAG: hypothetical protein HPAVJP_3810 [Candidatus Hepatoplasma vulgare]|nr:MAG: hypothetical protein HPAVJP_3810 [Candidatus Hepatoplasma sp.]
MNKIKKTHKKSWNKNIWAILISEFLGTLIRVLLIILPSAMAFTTPVAHQNNQDFWNVWSDIWSLIFMKAFWVALVIIFTSYFFRFVSANLNSSVTIAGIGYGKDNLKSGSLKIIFQILGGISAGFIAYLISDSMGLWNGNDNPANYSSTLNSAYPTWTRYNWGEIDYNNALYYTQSYKNMEFGSLFVTFSFFLEILYTTIYIGGVFLFKNVTHFWRPIVVGCGVWIAVVLGARTANNSINSATIIGSAVAYDVMSSVTGVNGDIMYTIWIPFYLLAQVIAGLAFAFYGRKLNKIIN